MKMFKIFLISIMLLFSFTVSSEQVERGSENLEIVVYRSPTCGCCGKWVKHLQDNQFNIEDIVTDDMSSIKEKLGVPGNLASCHTAIVDGYVIEGHVPARDIKRLLKIKPKVVGLSVPGMPAGTPGMEMGGRKDPYQVISFDKEGNYQVFSSYEAE